MPESTSSVVRPSARIVSTKWPTRAPPTPRLRNSGATKMPPYVFSVLSWSGSAMKAVPTISSASKAATGVQRIAGSSARNCTSISGNDQDVAHGRSKVSAASVRSYQRRITASSYTSTGRTVRATVCMRSTVGRGR